MAESLIVKQWRDDGIRQGMLQNSRHYLLKAVALRLQDPVPHAIRMAVEWTNDLMTLDRWYTAALTLDNIEELRKAMNLPSTQQEFAVDDREFQ
jgi:hypothetical protein